MLNKLKTKVSDTKTQFLAFLMLISLLFVPYIFGGESIQVRVFDNMDSILVWIKIALDSGEFFSFNSVVDQMMGGIPLHSIYGTYDLSLIIFNIFGIFWGYVVSKWLIALIGFCGMYLLLRKYFISDLPPYISMFVAFLFAILPFWSFTATVSGIPMVTYSFLNLRKGDKDICNWFILISYGFWSSLVTTGVFLLLVFTVIWIVDTFIKKRKKSLLFWGLTCLSITYLVSHMPLIMSYVNGDFITMRTEYKIYGFISLTKVLKVILDTFINGDQGVSRHAVSLHQYGFVFILATVFIMLKERFLDKRLFWLFGYVLFAAILFGIYDSYFFNPVVAFLLDLFPINFTRFYWLSPMCWYIILAISFGYIYKKYKYGVYIIIAVSVIQSAFIIYNLDYFFYKRQENITYEQFYSENQFKAIGEYINEPKSSYRVISIGIGPAVSLYNGFYTLDGMCIDYPLSYKHQFRRIIAKELDRNITNRTIFDNFGASCFTFIDGVDISARARSVEIDRTLELDYKIFKEMGGKFIISAAEINVEKNENLQLLKCFKKEDYSTSIVDIYLYRVLD